MVRGCALLLTGRIVFPAKGVARPRFVGMSELCSGLMGLGRLPRVDAGATANLVLLGLSALATRLAWWAPRAERAERSAEDADERAGRRVPFAPARQWPRIRHSPAPVDFTRPARPYAREAAPVTPGRRLPRTEMPYFVTLGGVIGVAAWACGDDVFA